MYMVDLTTLQAFSYIMGSLGVFLAATYYIFNLWYNRKAREMEICQMFIRDHTSENGVAKFATIINNGMERF